MNQITSKLGISRLCLTSFILLCSVFTSEVAISHRIWDKDCAEVTYDRNDNSITFKFLIYEFCYAFNVHGFLSNVDFYYCEVGNKKDYLLMGATTQRDKGIYRASICMHNKINGEKILFLNCYNFSKGMEWEDNKTLLVYLDLTDSKLQVDNKMLPSKIAHMIVKWDLSHSSKRIKYIKIAGFWRTNDERKSNRFEFIYPETSGKSNSNAIKNTPSKFQTEISDNVNISKDADGIIVTGAKPCENIKVYTTTGAEVKSVVTNDDVVNIKLPKNQIYIIKAGQAHYKVAL